MTDPIFPLSSRVVYKQTPLKNVTCEFRFPPLLRIESEVPADFQEKVRKTFPLFTRKKSTLIGDIPKEILAAMGDLQTGTSHLFHTEDSSTIIALTSGSISLSTTQYTRWEEFFQYINLMVKSFVEVYDPVFFSRVGLRYQNVIQRSALGLTDKTWGEILRPEIAGELAITAWTNNITEAGRTLRCRLDDLGSYVHIQHGLGNIENDPEICYILDFDFYNDKQMSTGEVNGTVERLHGYSGNGFRWAITDALDNAMDPEPT